MVIGSEGPELERLSGAGARVGRRGRAGPRRADERLSAALSTLELLHPDGVAPRSFLSGEPDPGGPLDLVVVEEATPAARELLRDRLAPDGLAYLALPARERAALARSAGLALGPALVELGRVLVPAERRALAWALTSLTASRRGRLAALAARAPAGARALGLLAGGAIARRPGARPLAAWLRARGPGTAVVAGPGLAFLVGGRRLRLVAKVGAGPPARRDLAEADALGTLGPAARAAGASVPTPVETGELEGRPLLVETALEGTAASVLLEARPGRVEAYLARLVDWLERWNAATATEAALSHELLEREVLAPARSVVAPEAYLAALVDRCRAADGRPVRLVAAHNDLTTANVLVRCGRLGIVDWDTAERRTLPLGDLAYAVADAQAAIRGFADRPGAFLACFAGSGEAARRAEALERRLAAALGLDAEVADLCFHACWLRHAANEALRPERAERPFRAIVQAIAERRIRIGG